MREILFRGVSKDSVEWVYGWFEKYPHTRWPLEESIIPSDKAEDGFFHHVKVIPETVGQFTGLTDKNGKKIFEGDFLLFDYNGMHHGVNGTAVVEFDNGKFGVRWGWHKEFVPLDGFANTTKEVIGNIHDNPELLEGGVS